MSIYPTFDHNAARIWAWNHERLCRGEIGYLSYSLDDRGSGEYSIGHKPLAEEIRYNGRIITPSGTATVLRFHPSSLELVCCKRIR